jgi:hypothetical protein
MTYSSRVVQSCSAKSLARFVWTPYMAGSKSRSRTALQIAYSQSKRISECLFPTAPPGMLLTRLRIPCCGFGYVLRLLCAKADR